MDGLRLRKNLNLVQLLVLVLVLRAYKIRDIENSAQLVSRARFALCPINYPAVLQVPTSTLKAIYIHIHVLV